MAEGDGPHIMSLNPLSMTRVSQVISSDLSSISSEPVTVSSSGALGTVTIENATGSTNNIMVTAEMMSNVQNEGLNGTNTDGPLVMGDSLENVGPVFTIDGQIATASGISGQNLAMAHGQQIIFLNQDNQQIAMPVNDKSDNIMLTPGVEPQVVGVLAGGSDVDGTGLCIQEGLPSGPGTGQGGVVVEEYHAGPGVGTMEALDSGQPMVMASGLGAPQTVTMLDSGAIQGLVVGQQAAKTPSGETYQVFTLQNAGSLLSQGSHVLQLLPGNAGSANVVTLGGLEAQGQQTVVLPKQEEATADLTNGQLMDIIGPLAGAPPAVTSLVLATNPAPRIPRPVPPGAPQWASRLNDCEKIGDSFRGWVESEIQLDLLLTLHKQQTSTFWGTRQSPSSAKPSTRLMWKSQYVPFDGIPFVNSGSRAIVLECQYGPRRRGTASKRQTPESPNAKGEFKQTCPARIYIKKVKKFPEYAVDITVDKKVMKTSMEHAFIGLRDRGLKGHGEERYYVQLPTEAAHEFHGDVEVVDLPKRLHPRLTQKIRELVSGGETRLYAIRKNLRRFVEKEMYSVADQTPEKHDLTCYPTVNDLQNHIHQAIKDIERGVLPVTASMVNVEVVDDCSNGEDGASEMPNMWQSISGPDQPHAETVTVTLTQNPEEDGQHVISKVETHLSDGTTQISTNLTPETARLLSKLHPNMFPSSSFLNMQSDSQQTLGATSVEEAIANLGHPDIETALVLKQEGAPSETDCTPDFTVVEDVDEGPEVMAIAEDDDSHLGGEDVDMKDDNKFQIILASGGDNILNIETHDGSQGFTIHTDTGTVDSLHLESITDESETQHVLDETG